MKILRAIGAVAVLVVVAIAEVGVRQFPDLMPVDKLFMEIAVHSHEPVVADPDVGFLAPPDMHRTVRTPDREFIWDTDAAGFPNPDPWPEQPAMVFLGDSMVLGHEVGQPNSFPQLIADALHSSQVNLALAAAGPERQLAVYRKFGMGLHPRYVVSCLYLVSDVRTNEVFTAWVREGRPGDYNTYRLTAPRDAGGWLSKLETYPKKSWLYVLGRDWLLSWLPGYIPDRHRFPDGSEVLLSRGAIKEAMTETSPQDSRIQNVMASMEKFRSVAAHGGSKLLTLLLPGRDELFGVPAGTTNATMRSRVLERLQAAGFSVLDLGPAVQQAGLQRSPYLRLDGHFNEYGHRVVAETFVSWFRRVSPETRDIP